MKNNEFSKSLLKGIIGGVGFLFTIFLGGVALIFAQNLSVNPGDQLTASMWNNLVNKVDNSVSFLTSETIEGGNVDEIVSSSFTIPAGRQAIVIINSNSVSRGTSSYTSLLSRLYTSENGDEVICSEIRDLNPSGGSNYVHMSLNSCNVVLNSGTYNIISRNTRANISSSVSEYTHNLSYSVLLK